MKYQVVLTSRFKKDSHRAKKQGRQLPKENKDHFLKGSFKGYRECHIESDWLLVYRIERDLLILTLSRTGAHSELFGK